MYTNCFYLVLYVSRIVYWLPMTLSFTQPYASLSGLIGCVPLREVDGKREYRGKVWLNLSSK
jgi:hypothetical protein